MIAREKLNPVIPISMGIQHGLNPSPFRAWIPGRALRDLLGMTMGLFFLNNETALHSRSPGAWLALYR